MAAHSTAEKKITKEVLSGGDFSKVDVPPIDSSSDDGSSCSEGKPGSNEEKPKLKGAKSIPATRSKPMSLKARGRIPLGIYVTVGIVALILFSAGSTNDLQNVVLSLQNTISGCWVRMGSILLEIINMSGFWCGSDDTCSAATSLFSLNAAWTIVVLGVVLAISYVLLYRPFRAGMWTGSRAKRHSVHRYMGLLYLIQYGIAWFDYITNNDESSRSYLPNTIALNGLIQATSAYFSFKVLPGLDDAGYYSDKAVLSRNFVFENIFYQLMSVFGSVFYNDQLRANMESSKLGQLLIIVFCFLPYVVLRPLYPTTRFKNAGTSMSGRSKENERFYSMATVTIKIFYLWAKYFLGFFINWLVFLKVPSDDDMQLIRGMFLLNVGTVSIAVFLHTLRFKKVLAPKFAFSLYLAQIYATFSAIPYAYAMFSAHRKLGALAFFGLLCNMTRNRMIHAAW
eukprot:CAMPEP_0195518584 /NCGR_PEP_ID=MMETSP0794_2-20130614/13258_1 /TAXON_ID=515487 /ORGANISM="Stephanopyxis turris, Strain CCMP 815" /LENGTH=452 /DNA_ID=CAMNT_0040647585 /DNA_START=16 /DNA_END=1371 /DNA_ORIENTATION=-